MTLPRGTPEDSWLTVKELAELKRVTERTVKRWIRDRKVIAERTVQPNGHWRVKCPGMP